MCASCTWGIREGVFASCSQVKKRKKRSGNVESVRQCSVAAVPEVLLSNSLLPCFGVNANAVLWGQTRWLCDLIKLLIWWLNNHYVKSAVLTRFSPLHRYKGADPKASSICPRPGPREETVDPHESSQHHPQVPYQQPGVPAAIPGAHHPPAGSALLQEAGGLGQAAARRDQPKGPQLAWEHLTAGNKRARIRTLRIIQRYYSFRAVERQWQGIKGALKAEICRKSPALWLHLAEGEKYSNVKWRVALKRRECSRLLTQVFVFLLI